MHSTILMLVLISCCFVSCLVCFFVEIQLGGLSLQYLQLLDFAVSSLGLLDSSFQTGI